MKMIDLAVEEVRKRRKMLINGKYGGSIEKMFESVRDWQKGHPAKVVNLRKRRTVKAVA